jgi:plastocyanin
MRRREFVEKAGIGAAAIVTAAQGRVRGSEKSDKSEEQHEHGPISGPNASATVSFGAWVSSPGDRHPNLGATAGVANNVHALIPNEVKIKAGGTVNFIIAGFHQVIVYGDGTKPGDINTTMPFLIPGAPPLIDDPANRIYRGISPFTLPLLQGPTQTGPVAGTFQPQLQDRVEVVHFPNPGTFLVICGVLPHFNEGMVGYVKVNP